jgi:hypothetical protein
LRVIAPLFCRYRFRGIVVRGTHLRHRPAPGGRCGSNRRDFLCDRIIVRQSASLIGLPDRLMSEGWY